MEFIRCHFSPRAYPQRDPAGTYGHHHPDYLQGAATGIEQKIGIFRWPNRWLTREKPAFRRKNLMKSGRSGRIRTCDPCVPNAVLYRAEPHSDVKAGLIAS